MATAYFRALDHEPAPEAPAEVTPARATAALAPHESTASPGPSLADVLVDEGILPPAPRALLEAPADRPERLAVIQSHLRYLNDLAPVAYLTRTQELAYLANTLVAGCALQGRAFTLDEATEATVAVCNLGLEHWPAHWRPGGTRARVAAIPPAALAIDFLVGHDLIGVFQVRWSVLHQQVCIAAADALVSALGTVQCGDRDTRAELKALRTALRTARRAGAPWRVRGSLDDADGAVALAATRSEDLNLHNQRLVTSNTEGKLCARRKRFCATPYHGRNAARAQLDAGQCPARVRGRCCAYGRDH